MKRLVILYGVISCVCVNLVAVNLPESYGKTQFIVGFNPEIHEQVSALEEHLTTGSTMVQGAACRVFFSPDDNIRQQLLDCIKRERKSIKMAAFALTDRDIAQALVDAKKRGVAVEVVVDQSGLKGFAGKASWLHEQGIPVYVYVGVATNSSMSNIMHNKFMVFAQNAAGAPLVCTGSYNFTNSAQENNQENMVILTDAQTVEKFNQQFGILKARCVPCEKVNGAQKNKKSVVARNKTIKSSTKSSRNERKKRLLA